ncbi:MAG: 3-oxoacyl-[acyl-carrier-protein] reductase FabG [Pseudomonas sp.]|nr:MAG: 3-oxoacyl-[acyl-carrier-protein] reductase FabG [Pseudomonas sp.]
MAADLNLEAAQVTADAIISQGGRSMALQWDLGRLEDIGAHISSIESLFGTVDILVNNTGGPPPTPVAGQDLGLWQKQFEAMVLSVISITDHVLPGMKARQWGRIITSASSGVVSPIPNLGISNALRMSLVGWSKTLAREVAAEGITSNIILPGRIATARIGFLDQKKAEREGRTVEDVRRESTESIPAGRYGEPQEYADTVTFLASARASYITGSVIRVDGGLISSI